MYCKHCGKQIADDSKFCNLCGGNLDGPTPLRTTNQNTSLSNKAVSIYLHDVLTLEIAVKHLQEKINDNKKQITSTQTWGNGNDIAVPKTPRIPAEPIQPKNQIVTLLKDSDTRLTFFGIGFLIGAVAGIVTFFPVCNDSYSFSGDLLGAPLLGLAAGFGVFIACILSSLLIWLIYTAIKAAVMHAMALNNYENKLIPQHQLNMQNYAMRHNEYLEKKKEYSASLDKRKRDADKKIASLIDDNNKLENSLNEANHLLSQAYDANIVPKKYRGLYPIYFLDDYLSSSNETLESALLQCQLDNLENQLSQVIKANKIMIMQNAIQIAKQEALLASQEEGNRIARRSEIKQERIISQNQSILAAERKSVNNTALSAEYSRIAAINSEVSAYWATFDHLH